ncbi:MAG TPA: serine/threonine-protein kinase [Ktedonobacteraceae bacterium]
MEKGNVRRMRAEHLLDRTLAGYRLLEILGRGGMSIVFLAQHLEHPQSRVAIKILMPSDISTTDESSSFQARFQREVLAVHQLRHEHILPVITYGEEDNLYYMVMPMIVGGTLAQRLSSASGALPLDEIARYLDQLSSAVDYAHQNGMVHRDIKPSNVLTDEDGNVYLADFGLVHLFASGHLAFDQDLTTLTTIGKIYGTPAYMAPERYKGEPAEPATDIYALGVLLYQLVTGQMPFDADNPLALGLKHLSEEPLPPRSLRPDLPEPAEGAILKAIAKQPADRFVTASALARAFDAGLKANWEEKLQSSPAALATNLSGTTVKRAVVADTAIPEAVQPAQLVLAPVPDVVDSDVPLELAATVADVPVVARPLPRSRRSLQMVALGLLGIVVFVCVGLLAFAAYKVINLGVPASAAPGIHTLSTSTSGLPTRTNRTPVSPAGATPSSKSTATLAGTPTSAPSASSTPAQTPTTRPTQASTPASPSATPTSPAPTPTSTPAPSPTAQGTP